MKPVGIVGSGCYIPKEIRTNEFFEQFEMLTSIDVFEKSGVKERRISARGELSSDMETKALLAAVENAGISIEDIDLILDGPNVNDQISPLNAPALQYKSGAKNAVAMNVDMACASLIPQLQVASALVGLGWYDTVACVVASVHSKFSDFTEKSCMILGDGAVAFILKPVSEGKGIISVHMETEGQFHRTVGVDWRLPYSQMKDYKFLGYTGGLKEDFYFYVNRTSEGGSEQIKESGPERLVDVIRKALAKVGYTQEDIDFFTPHNPTAYLCEEWRTRLGLPPEKMHITVEKFGTMGPASMAMNLHEASTMGKIKEGDLVVVGGPGGGFHNNAAVIRWGK